ncbi:MAG TPA: hypothetical protein VFG49_08080 [Dyella sp.]|uniref:hypothetical protein n=1 Tax=Dyella sp. TaxID=1869338 RepID=UPI002D76FFB2|nr:hypothetical protein [Dyella sp.]HET6553479.1 hypothetical protein [Dyella sp.]
MHFEVPKVRMQSFREFVQHYLMIVLSILTALGLEQWIESTHHRHAADQARTQIEAELRSNIADIRMARTNNDKRLAPLKQLNELVMQDLHAGAAAKAVNEHIRANRDKFTISITWPTFYSQAWDVAVANQSASWIDADELRRYSAAYAAQREASTWMTNDSTISLDARRMVDLRTRIELGMDVDPVDFLTVLHQMINTATETQSHLDQAEQQLLSGVPEAAPATGKAP